ncbi:unnamed protein product [Paramecium pentaurelia]|uniref:Transmembrane protein n=1 Tax=Paramecium pentaurelia TaxID=43138 RepID=A0A8S1VTR2_9CILI|nr:unnamed protein product [Paramecium pentaurelia]
MIFIVFCLTIQVYGYLNLELGQTYNDAIIPWQGDKNYKYYEIDIQQVIKDRDLIIVVKQQSTIGNPDIYISSLDQKPDKIHSEIQCNSQGMDICVIQQPEKKIYYLAVYCEEYCRYNLKVVYQEELMMTNYDDLEFKFNNTSWTEIIRINITQLQKQQIQQDYNLEVSVQVKNVEILQESFLSFMNLGLEKPSLQKYEYKGQDTFLGIQKFKIKKIMTNQIYTLLVEAQQGAIVQIKTRTYGSTRFMNVGEQIEDVISENELGFYVLNVTTDQELFYLGQLILNIQLISYKGYTEMYVNLDENPASLEDYQWKLRDGVTDDLIISNEDLNRFNSKGYYIYIAILAKESYATFELKTQMLNPNFMVMELNKPAISKMSKFKFHQYKFNIKSNKQQSVSVSLRNIKGDADIILKLCKEFWTCKYNEEEQIQFKSKDFQNNNFINQYYYSLNPGNDIIIFDYLPANCLEHENFHICFYAILIIPGQQNDEDELTYSILITTKQDSIILKENTPIKQFVFHEFYNYYKFTVNNDDHIQRLFIQLTPIQGQPRIFSSRTEIYPTKEQNDNQGVQNLIIYGAKGIQSSINGTIYIGVYGETASQYIITAIVFRKQDDWGTIGKYAHQYIQLIEGYPQEIITSHSTDVQLFKIDLSGYSNNNQVKVFLRINSGEFIMYGFDHPEIDLKQAIKTGSNSLILTDSIEKYPQYLFVRVQTNQSTTYSLYSYSIHYRISSQPIELVLGDNYQGFIEKSDKQIFFVNFYKKEDIYINLHAESVDQSILQATIYIEDDTIEMNQQSMIITANQIKYDKCKKTEEIVQCIIAIHVESSEDTQFTLLISKESQIIKLYNEESITKTIKNQLDFFTFLLTEETEIATFSITANIRILVNIIQLDPPTLEQFPTNDDNSQFQSLNDDIIIESSVFITLNDIQKINCDKTPCYAAVTCINSDSQNQNNNEYTIIRSSGAFKLTEGFSYTGKIKYNQIKYFKVTDYNEATGLQIIVTNSERNFIVIYASVNQMPTQQSHDYSSNFNFGDFLIIPPKKNSKQIVTYYIGVFALKEVTISIQIKLGSSRFYRLNTQKPFYQVFPWNSKTYLSFYNGQQIDFSILISSNAINQYIKPKIHVRSYQINELSEVINSIQTQYHWKMEDLYLEITTNQENFCFNCYFMIYIENNFLDIELTITIARKDFPIQLFDNIEIKNKLKINETQKYFYFPYRHNEFYLNVTVFQGQIYLFDKKNKTDKEFSNLLLVLDEKDGTLDYQKNQIGSREGIYANRTLIINVINDENDLQVYYLKVFSNITNESIYQIEIIGKNQAIELKVGQPQRFSIGQLFFIPFYFVIPNGINNSIEDYYTITIEQINLQRDKSTRAPDITLKNDRYNNPNILSDYHDFVDANISFVQDIDSITYIQIPSIAGLYFLTINPIGQNTFTYCITLGNKDYNILTPKSQRIVRTKVGEQKVWEIHIFEMAKLFIQIQLCGGIVHVFGSASRDNLTMGFYKDKIESVHNQQLSGTIPFVLPNTYYINTQTIKNTTQTDVVSYILSLDILKQDTIVPLNHFYPGNGGDFQISIIENHINFDYSPIQSSEKSSQDYLLESITYIFIYQNQSLNDNTQLYKCNYNSQYHSFTTRRIQHDPQNNLNQRIYIGEDQYEKLLASIQAIVKIQTNNYETLQLSYYYNTQILEQKIITQNIYYENYRGIFIIILSVLFFVFFLLIIKFRNLKQMTKFETLDQQPIPQKEQQIEMNYTNLRSS